VTISAVIIHVPYVTGLQDIYNYRKKDVVSEEIANQANELDAKANA
jgi:hypothetical protein